MANVLLYIIVGWAVSETFHLFGWEYVKKKLKLNDKKVKSIFIFLSIGIIIILISSGFYRVNSYENVIVTSLNGNKYVNNDTGIKYSLLSSREIINLQRQIIKFPVVYEDNGYEIITLDNKPLLINSFLEYKIENVRKWGIENKDTDTKLLVFLSSEVKKNIQNTNYDDIKNNPDIIKNKITNGLYETENLYGIKLISFNLQISDTLNIRQSKAESEIQKIESNTLKESYQNEADAIKIKYNSISDKGFIKYLEFINAIEQGDINTIVIPENLNIPLYLNDE